MQNANRQDTKELGHRSAIPCKENVLQMFRTQTDPGTRHFFKKILVGQWQQTTYMLYKLFTHISYIPWENGDFWWNAHTHHFKHMPSLRGGTPPSGGYNYAGKKGLVVPPTGPILFCREWTMKPWTIGSWFLLLHFVNKPGEFTSVFSDKNKIKHPSYVT